MPSKFPLVALEKIARIFAGSSAPQERRYFAVEGPCFIRVRDVSSSKGDVLTQTRDCLSLKAIVELPLVKAKKGTVVFPKSGAAIATNNRSILGVDGYIVSHLMALEADRELVCPEWIFYALRCVDMMHYANNPSYPSLKAAAVKKIKIPLPPLSEQRRIVARLRQELKNCDEICRAAESQSENARAFPALLLRGIFRQVNHFPMVVLSDLCDVLRGVVFSANQSHNFSFAGSVACATTKSVQEEVDWESCRHIPAGVVKNHARILQVGDILISIANSKELVGKISVVRAIPFRATFGAFVAVLRSNKGVLPEFLALYLRAPQVKRYFYTHSSNTTNISNLNMRRVMAMPVALPSLAEQRRLVNYSRAQLKNGADISVAAERRLESARALPQAFLRRAFS